MNQKEEGEGREEEDLRYLSIGKARLLEPKLSRLTIALFIQKIPSSTQLSTKG